MTPCRTWRGPVSTSGYGVLNKGGRRVYLHRWVVAQVEGWEAIAGRVVMHVCDNRLCYRYDHLRVGSHADNQADMVAKGRNRRGSGRPRRDLCRLGHPIAERAGHRYCRTCHNDAANRRRSRR